MKIGSSVIGSKMQVELEDGCLGRHEPIADGF